MALQLLLALHLPAACKAGCLKAWRFLPGFSNVWTGCAANWPEPARRIPPMGHSQARVLLKRPAQW